MLIKSIPQQLKKALLHELKDPYFRVFLILLAIGIFLRFYKIEGFITFLGDQGRDAIIMRKIAILEHFPAVGAPSSVGMIFLGPFFYYLMAPWLLLFNFSPLGPAVGVATLSSLGTVVAYFMVKDLFDRKVALLTAIFFLFSNVVVELSRFSWNPNLLSFFSLFSTYFLIKALKTGRGVFYVLAGLFISFAIQLHYVMLALFLPFGLWVLWDFVKSDKSWLQQIKNIGLLILSFLAGILPLIIFDMRHQFLNATNFIDFVIHPKGPSSMGFDEIINTFAPLNGHLLGLEFHYKIGLAILMTLFGLIFILLKHRGHQDNPQKDIFLFLSSTFLIGLVITSYFTRDKHAHYFGALYGIYFVILAYLLAHTLWKKKREILLAIALVLFIAFQSKEYYFLHGTPNNQIQKGERVAKIIFQNVKSEKYQITGVPDMYDDNIYRYFLEVWGKKPLAKDSIEKGDELFAICERECSPLDAPQWSVTFFKPREIVKKWQSENVTIYKMVR